MSRPYDHIFLKGKSFQPAFPQAEASASVLYLHHPYLEAPALQHWHQKRPDRGYTAPTSRHQIHRMNLFWVCIPTDVLSKSIGEKYSRQCFEELKNFLSSFLIFGEDVLPHTIIPGHPHLRYTKQVAFVPLLRGSMNILPLPYQKAPVLNVHPSNYEV